MASAMRAHLRSRDTLAVLVLMQLCQLALAIPLMHLLRLPGFALASPWLLARFSADAGIVAAGVTLMWLTVLLEPGRTFIWWSSMPCGRPVTRAIR